MTLLYRDFSHFNILYHYPAHSSYLHLFFSPIVFFSSTLRLSFYKISSASPPTLSPKPKKENAISSVCAVVIVYDNTYKNEMTNIVIPMSLSDRHKTVPANDRDKLVTKLDGETFLQHITQCNPCGPIRIVSNSLLYINDTYSSRNKIERVK